MRIFNRGVKNAIRNDIQMVSVVLILALSIGLALVMLLIILMALAMLIPNNLSNFLSQISWL